MEVTELRPLGVGEVLDFAIKVCRPRYLTLVKIVAVVVVPMQILSAIIRTSTLSNNTVATSPNGTTHLSTAGWTAIAGSLVGGILVGLASQLASAASLKSLSGAYVDEQATWRESIGYAWSRFGSVILVAFLVAVLSTLALFVFVIPGVYLWGSWVVAVPVLLLEGTRGRKALKRSRELVKGRWWPTFATYLLATLIVTIFSGILGAIFGAIVGVSHSGELAQILVNSIAGILAGVITTPFIAAVIVVIYFDLRVRKEGFDLAMLAHHVGGTPRRPEEPPWPQSPLPEHSI